MSRGRLSPPSSLGLTKASKMLCSIDMEHFAESKLEIFMYVTHFQRLRSRSREWDFHSHRHSATLHLPHVVSRMRPCWQFPVYRNMRSLCRK